MAATCRQSRAFAARGLRLLLLSGLWLASAASAQQTLRGEVTLPEGGELPRGAVMDIYIEDQARADAPADILAQTQLIPSGEPPYGFSLSYDSESLSPRGRYGMRVRMSVDGDLWYINTRHVPAFEAGPQGPVTVPVEAVGVAARPGTAFFSPLPALFTGSLGCDGCEPSEHFLELSAAGYFVYQIDAGDRGAGGDDIGRWVFDPEAQRLTLHGGREAPVVFAVDNSHLLTRLGSEGDALYPDGESQLNRAAACTALEPRLVIGGMLRYMADAAVLRECLTGQQWPVAIEGDFAAAERAYLQALRETGTEPGGPLYVMLEASLAQRPVVDGEGMRRTVVMERFIDIRPGESCPAGPAAPDR